MKKIMFCSSLRKAMLAMFAAAVGVECLQAGTIAFYPFTDGDPGSSALSTDLLNSTDSTRFKGTSKETWVGLSGVDFSDEVPGRYLFDGSGFKEETYVDSYGSIDIWGRTNASGGPLNDTSSATVSFEDIAAELSTNSEWTIEFYHKTADKEYCAGAALIAFDAGYSFEGVSGHLKINFSDSKGFRGSMDTSYTPGGKILFYLVGQLTEMRGVWHHFALTYDGTTMSLYHDHVSKSTATFTAGEAAEHAALLFGNKGYRGKICALRVSDRALKSYEMLHASDNPTLVDRVVWDLPVEGVAGAAVESEHAVAGGGVDPVYAARRQMKVVDDGVVVGITSNCAHLVTTSKASKDETYASGPGLRVLKSSVADRLDGSFTMEGYFKFDAAEWERKVGSFVVDGVAETRIRMTIMGQKWSNGSRSQLWTFGFHRASDGTSYLPRIDCNYDAADGSVTAVTRINPSSTTLTVDGNWHRYVVTYDHPTYTFVCYEDDREILRTTLLGGLSYTFQGDWLVGTGIGNHPFEGYVDSIRLSRGVLPTSAFRTMEKVLTGFIISVQ